MNDSTVELSNKSRDIFNREASQYQTLKRSLQHVSEENRFDKYHLICLLGRLQEKNDFRQKQAIFKYFTVWRFEITRRILGLQKLKHLYFCHQQKLLSGALLTLSYGSTEQHELPKHNHSLRGVFSQEILEMQEYLSRSSSLSKITTSIATLRSEQLRKIQAAAYFERALRNTERSLIAKTITQTFCLLGESSRLTNTTKHTQLGHSSISNREVKEGDLTRDLDTLKDLSNRGSIDHHNSIIITNTNDAANHVMALDSFRMRISEESGRSLSYF